MVDQNTRRKMVEMLRTWKEPVPGSIDPRPVFEPEFVAPIDAALMKVLGPGSGGRVTQSVPSPVPTPPGRLPRQQSPYGVPPSQFPLPVNGGSQRPCSQSHAATVSLPCVLLRNSSMLVERIEQRLTCLN